jgi:hypothetical protein
LWKSGLNLVSPNGRLEDGHLGEAADPHVLLWDAKRPSHLPDRNLMTKAGRA